MEYMYLLTTVLPKLKDEAICRLSQLKQQYCPDSRPLLEYIREAETTITADFEQHCHEFGKRINALEARKQSNPLDRSLHALIDDQIKTDLRSTIEFRKRTWNSLYEKSRDLLRKEMIA